MKQSDWIVTSAAWVLAAACGSPPEPYHGDIAWVDGALAQDVTATAEDATGAADTAADGQAADSPAEVAPPADVTAEDTASADSAAGDTAAQCTSDEQCNGILKPGLCQYTRCLPKDGAMVCQMFSDKDGKACADAECLTEGGSPILQARVCKGGTCGAVATTVPCTDSNACTTDTCNVATGCAHSILPCTDGDACTTDQCDPASGCVFPPANATPCDDGNACTSGDVCQDGSCVAGPPKICPKGGPCQVVACNAASGLCQTTSAADGSACDDGNSCTKQDVCKKGVCIGAGNPCDDGNICTFDGCAAGSCQSSPAPGSCDVDGSLCTTDTCLDKVCQAGGALSCDDGNLCTIDSCSPTAGCVHKAQTFATPCAASKYCGQGGQAGQCVAAAAPAGMAWVPGATVNLGCNLAVDNFCNPDEKPSHSVTLASFFIDLTEATVAQYTACVQGGACTVPGSGANATYGAAGKTNHPVNFVTWQQAATYCLWAGGSRLCTEAEWEYAARGTDGRRYPWGNNPSTACEYANWGGACGGITPVGQFAKGNSPWGVSDLAGNVREWTSDWYGSGYYAELAAAGTAVTAPAGPATGSGRSVRGGYFSDNAPELRTSARAFATPPTSTFSIGIRCCRTPK